MKSTVMRFSKTLLQIRYMFSMSSIRKISKFRFFFNQRDLAQASNHSVADPERFNADPDPTFQADADPDPNSITRVKKMFLQIFNYCFQI